VAHRTGVHLSIFGGGPTGDEVEYLKDVGKGPFKFDSTYRMAIKWAVGESLKVRMNQPMLKWNIKLRTGQGNDPLSGGVCGMK
jgi:hypothetical protein